MALVAAALILWPGAPAAGLTAQEGATIEALIAAVERLSDADFIRNDRAYTAAEAAQFLRRKWRMKASAVASAADFIARVASYSDTTGRPYRIRLGDGREIPSSLFLRGELERLRQPRR
jgi:hypothetical protein